VKFLLNHLAFVLLGVAQLLSPEPSRPKIRFTVAHPSPDLSNCSSLSSLDSLGHETPSWLNLIFMLAHSSSSELLGSGRQSITIRFSSISLKKSSYFVQVFVNDGQA
jgi:hypothetical protein